MGGNETQLAALALALDAQVRHGPAAAGCSISP